MAFNEYVVYPVGDGKVYVKIDRLEILRLIKGVIFDCDGVLIDVRGSYDRAISKTVAFILQNLTGYTFREQLISDEVIHLFRKTGGFNNDWDTVYGALMFIICSLPYELREKLKRCIKNVELYLNPYERLARIKEAMKKENRREGLGEEFFEDVTNRFKEFTAILDETGVSSVDAALLEKTEKSEAFANFYNLVKNFLKYPAGVHDSIISRVFEEFFCGAKLFRETYGTEPKFNKGQGMIENEKIIPQSETLNRLASIFGKENLGIVSGGRLKPARHALGNILDEFNPYAQVFLDYIEEAEWELSIKTGSRVNLKKPNPFPLLKAAENLGQRAYVLYVGDSMEDALMVRKANELDNRFFFAGVYNYSGLKDAVLQTFLESRCDIILPSVNELLFLFQTLRGEGW